MFNNKTKARLKEAEADFTKACERLDRINGISLYGLHSALSISHLLLELLDELPNQVMDAITDISNVFDLILCLCADDTEDMEAISSYALEFADEMDHSYEGRDDLAPSKLLGKYFSNVTDKSI